MGCLISHVVLPEDDSATMFNKKIILVSCLMGIIGFLSEVITHLNDRGAAHTRRYVGLSGCVVGLAQLLIEKRIRHNVVEGVLYAVGFTILVASIEIIIIFQGAHHSWPLYLIILDICLLCNLRARVSRNLLIGISCWFILITIENTFRFGLYDLPFFARQSYRREAVSCSTLPCPREPSHSFIALFYQLVVVLLDFYFTRGFAHGLLKEHEIMNQAIQATEEIATSLSRFDLASAEDIIESASLPPPLHQAFSAILANLHIYRPYLPQSVLFGDSGSDDTGEEDNQSQATGGKESVCLQDSVSSLLEAVHAVQVKVLERKRCSFTVTNMLGSIGEAASDPAAYQEKYKHFMECLSEQYLHLSGVVGAVVGDHVHASFNTTKRCASHAKNAVQAAVNLRDGAFAKGIEVVTGVSSGTAFCGSLGCSEIMSVGMIGTPSITASVLQDLGRSGGHKVVCCSTVYSEVSFAFTMKVIITKVNVKHVNEVAYEVLVMDGKPLETGQEWMYELGQRPWESYNLAGKLYLLGDREEALRVLGIETQKPSSVSLAEEELKCMVSSNTCPLTKAEVVESL